MLQAHPRLFITAWFVIFSAIAAVPISAYLYLRNPVEPNYFVAYGIASIVSAALCAFLLAPQYLKRSPVSPGRSIGLGVLIALLSLLLAGFIAELIMKFPGRVDSSIILFSSLSVFPAALLFVGWIIVPVGAIAGMLLYFMQSREYGKGLFANIIFGIGLLILITDIIMIYGPLAVIRSQSMIERTAMWNICCKYMKHGFGPAQTSFIELSFTDGNNKIINTQLIPNTPEVLNYLKKHTQDDQVRVSIAVQSLFGRRSTYRIIRLGEHEIGYSYYEPINKIAIVFDTEK